MAVDTNHADSHLDKCTYSTRIRQIYVYNVLPSIQRAKAVVGLSEEQVCLLSNWPKINEQL